MKLRFPSFFDRHRTRGVEAGRSGGVARTRTLTATLLPIMLLGTAPVPERVDLLIRGGTVFTGNGDPFVGDVAVVGDRIYVGPHAIVTAARTVETRTMIASPGFIDPHTHRLESGSARIRLVLPFLVPGVTTAFTANDGRATVRPVGTNYTSYVGLGSVREQVIGTSDRAPTPAELDCERALVAAAMCANAMGLTPELFYAPRSFAETSKVVTLAREAGSGGGIDDSHIGDNASYTVELKAAVAEAIAVGQQASLPVHLSHVRALGRDVQGSAPAIIAMVEAARARGQTVTPDHYPWSVSSNAQRVLSLAEFIHRSTALTADTFALTRRGHLRTDAFAVDVMFDPARYAPAATYQGPERLARGVNTVVVNGRLAVANGRATGIAAGRALRQVPPAGRCR